MATNDAHLFTPNRRIVGGVVVAERLPSWLRASRRRVPTHALVGQEELFELRIVGGDGLGEFSLVEVAGQAFGERWGLADGLLDYVGEFGGVGCGQH